MTLVLLLLLCCLVSCAYDGQRGNAVLLNGAWEAATGDGSEKAELPASQTTLTWQPVRVPNWQLIISKETATSYKCVWARRSFQVSKTQANSLAVLRWNQISWGATAFVNGQQVGEYAPTGPYQVLLPPGVLKEGENSIILRVNGLAGVPRAKSGHILVPAGFADEATSAANAAPPNISDDVWIDFADSAYMKWLLAMPDLVHGSVSLRVTPVAREVMAGLTLTAEVTSWPDGKRIGRATSPTKATAYTPAELATDPLKPAFTHVVQVPMPNFRPWTYEKPVLYTARVTLSRGKQVLDTATFRFGMREIKVRGGHYQLNGKNLWLRGSELVADWKWAPGVPGHEFDYLVTEALEMSMNAFRTHTQPPPASWADICDEHGTMLLAEFPVLFNAADYHFTPEEYQIWHKNSLDDALGWIGYLGNHPSVVTWVLSNESLYDNAWEQGPYDDFVHALDPTRPTMRTGQSNPKAGTRDNTDWHPCDNITDAVEGHLFQQLQALIDQRDHRTMTATEYMNIFSWTPKRGWTGTTDRDVNVMAMTQIGMEHTEAMRRARLDAILPYMYAGWTKTRMGKEWKAGFASPTSACWHSSLSPVLASLDLFNPNYVTGQQVTTDLYLINDSWHDAKIHVDLLITKENPEFIPEAACFEAPVAKWSFDYSVPTDSVQKTPVKWTLPAEEGSYWLTARTTGLPGRPVLSTRFVRVVKTPEPSVALKARTFVLLGGDAEATTYFTSRGLKTTGSVAGLKPAEHLVVIWNADNLTAADKEHAAELRDFADAGGRVVVLGGKAWDWPGFCEVLLDGNCHGSRIFAYEDVKSPLFTGISRDMFSRWNGLPGTVAMGALHAAKTGKPLATVEKAKPLAWILSLDWPSIAEVPTVTGKGSVLFAILGWQGRLDRTKPNYDPVAERVLLNFLQ